MDLSSLTKQQDYSLEGESIKKTDAKWEIKFQIKPKINIPRTIGKIISHNKRGTFTREIPKLKYFIRIGEFHPKHAINNKYEKSEQDEKNKLV